MTWVRCYLPSLAYQRLGICDVSTKTWVCYPFAIHPLFKPLFVHAVSFSSVSHYAISQNKFTTRENVSVCISICSASGFFFLFLNSFQNFATGLRIEFPEESFLCSYFPYTSWLQGGPNKCHLASHLLRVVWFIIRRWWCYRWCYFICVQKTDTWSLLLPKHLLYICGYRMMYICHGYQARFIFFFPLAVFHFSKLSLQCYACVQSFLPPILSGTQNCSVFIVN